MSERAFLIALLVLLSLSTAIILAFLSLFLWELVHLVRQLRQTLARMEHLGGEFFGTAAMLLTFIREEGIKTHTLLSGALRMVKEFGRTRRGKR